MPEPSTFADHRCGKPTKKGTPCSATRHYWYESDGYTYASADGCWRHMSLPFREAAARRKRQEEVDWEAYLASDPICWGWPLPDDLDAWSRLRSDDINDQLSAATIAMISRNPESRAAAILGHWQDGRCAICGRRNDLVEDHDHMTGMVRGYLCRGCNTQEGVYGGAGNLFGRYRLRHPTKMLGLTIRYWDPIAGDYARPLSERPSDPWENAASEGIGL